MALFENKELIIRKLRKKLRQIENLANLRRPLNNEERQKIALKESIRLQLQNILNINAEFIQSLSSQTTESLNSSIGASLEAQFDTEDDYVNSSLELNTSAFQHLNDNSVPLVITAPKDLSNVNDQLPSTLPENICEGNPTLVVEKRRNAVLEPRPAKRPKNDSKAHHSAATTESSQVHTPSQSTNFSLPAKDPSDYSRLEESAYKDTLRQWMKSRFSLMHIEGHSDIITSICLIDLYLLSASRDTTIRLWNVQNGNLMHIFGGHTDCVTCVWAGNAAKCGILNVVPNSSDELNVPYGQLDSDDILIVSGSWDCTLKLWSLKRRQLLSQVYTFCPITQLFVLPFSKSYSLTILVGSNGGKLECYCLQADDCAEYGFKFQQMFSLTLFDCPVIGIDVLPLSTNIVVDSENTELTPQYLIAAAGNAGRVKIMRMSRGNIQALPLILFASEDQVWDVYQQNENRLNCMIMINERLLVLGDNSGHLLFFDWKSNKFQQLPNNISPFSITDCLCVLRPTDDVEVADSNSARASSNSLKEHRILLSSAYDLDTGKPMVHLRRASVLAENFEHGANSSIGEHSSITKQPQSYLVSLLSESCSERIMCMATCVVLKGRTAGWLPDFVMATGGHQLLLWKQQTDQDNSRANATFDGQVLRFRNMEAAMCALTGFSCNASDDDEASDDQCSDDIVEVSDGQQQLAVQSASWKCSLL